MYRKVFKDILEDVKVGYTGGYADVSCPPLATEPSHPCSPSFRLLDLQSPNYRQVCSGSTNHAEACKIIFDPSKVSYAELIEFHFRMHDPSAFP